MFSDRPSWLGERSESDPNFVAVLTRCKAASARRRDRHVRARSGEKQILLLNRLYHSLSYSKFIVRKLIS